MSLWKSTIEETVAQTLEILGDQETPLRWAAVIPTLPIRKIISPTECLRLHELVFPPDVSLRTVPSGTLSITASEQGDTWVRTGITHVSQTGLVFAAEHTAETRRTRFVSYTYTRELFEDVFAGASTVYHELQVNDLPLTLCVGMANALNSRMQSQRERVGHPFPGESFLTSETLTSTTFCNDYSQQSQQVYTDFQWAFDVAPELP